MVVPTEFALLCHRSSEAVATESSMSCGSHDRGSHAATEDSLELRLSIPGRPHVAVEDPMVVFFSSLRGPSVAVKDPATIYVPDPVGLSPG